MGGSNIPDELFHIGSALLFGGFSVVATMWHVGGRGTTRYRVFTDLIRSISDMDGTTVADALYVNLFKQMNLPQRFGPRCLSFPSFRCQIMCQRSFLHTIDAFYSSG